LFCLIINATQLTTHPAGLTLGFVIINLDSSHHERVRKKTVIECKAAHRLSLARAASEIREKKIFHLVVGVTRDKPVFFFFLSTRVDYTEECAFFQDDDFFLVFLVFPSDRFARGFVGSSRSRGDRTRRQSES